MTCSPFDVRDYLLGELDAAGRRAVEAHARACAGCQEELDRLRIAQAALLSVRDEEIPQRIAFVSDKVFEPAPWRRWAGRLAFAIPALLLALVLWQRPTPAPAPAALAALEARFAARVTDAVAQAVAASEARQQRKTAELLAAAEQRYDRERRELLLSVEENLRVMSMRSGSLYLASNSGASQ
jgi:hypothetical protein